jgi:hypothetical protein
MSDSFDARQRLLELLDELPHWLGRRWQSPLLPPRQSPHLSVDIDLDGERVRLLHALDPSEQHLLLLECRVGQLPPRGSFRTQALAVLLDQNFRMSSERSCAFAIDPEFGELVFVTPCSLADATAQTVAELIRSGMSWAAAARIALPEVASADTAS